MYVLLPKQDINKPCNTYSNNYNSICVTLCFLNITHLQNLFTDLILKKALFPDMCYLPIPQCCCGKLVCDDINESGEGGTTDYQ